MKRLSLIGFAAVLAVVCAVAPVLRAQESNIPSTPFRLPADVAVPVRYQVDLTVVPDQDTFTGSSDIVVNFKKVTPILWLNSQKLPVKQGSPTFHPEEYP